MKLFLNNIGVVANSTINIDGLTVITGQNNSGKTTVGKAIYSITSAVENLQNNAFNDKKSYSDRIIRQSIETFEFYRYIRNNIIHGEQKVSFGSYIDRVINSNKIDFDSLNDIIAFINELIAEITDLTPDSILEKYLDSTKGVYKIKIKESLRTLDATKATVSKNLKLLIVTLISDSNLVGYTNANIIKTLRREFNEQIQPVKADTKNAEIKLFDEDKKYFEIFITKNQMDKNGECYFNSAFDSSIFIDNIDIVDAMTFNVGLDERRYFPRLLYNSYANLLDSIVCHTHDYKLLLKLIKSKNNLYEEVVNEKSAESILNLIFTALPDSISYVDNKFITSSNKLDIRNLASGSKMFLIIKLLLQNGHLNGRTLLILDEPETHLHPSWQNILAEIIVLLVNSLDVKILLTTHSPNFLLALDVFSKKHKTRNKTHFYQSKLLKDKYRVEFECIDDNINEAYATLSAPFLEMDILRDKLSLHGK